MTNASPNLTLVHDSTKLVVNHKAVVDYLGYTKAGMIEFLIEKQELYTSEGKLYNNMFYVTYPKWNKLTKLGEHAVRKLIRELEDEGLISTKKQGMPVKMYYLVRTTKIKQLKEKLIEEFDAENEW